ncbi:MAG TPA: GAF domain-containing sensor histidine kinase [Actinomycetota bacterium]|jgi:signal transduction histidine kinase
MDEASVGPQDGLGGTALRAINDAVLAIAAERSVEPVLQKIVDSARALVRARYAALGVPDGEGGFSQFIVSGISDAMREAIGELPRTHGLLGAMLEDPAPIRLRDIKSHPDFQGWWPERHPRMRSFLGVPLVSKGRIIGAFYLASKIGAREFSRTDQELVEMLAAHAAIAIENTELLERSRELTVMEERNRLARELHDSVIQTLFSAVFTAEAAAELLDRDPGLARGEVQKLQELAKGAVQEMRSLVFELRPAEIEVEGLVPTLRKHVDVLRRVYGTDIDLTVEGGRRLNLAAERELFRIAQEAIRNALKHSGGSRISVDVRMRDSMVSLSVSDDGVGFDPSSPQVRGRHLGLTSMLERAELLGGDLHIESAPGAGARVWLEARVGG